MSDGLESAEESFASRAVPILIISVVLFALISFLVIDKMSHNTYSSLYYTLAALFDAGGVGGFDTPLISTTPLFSQDFYILTGISLIDGMIKVVIVSFLIASLLDLITGINIKSKIVARSAHQMIGHVIVCGYSPLGEKVCDELAANKKKFVIIDKDKTKIEEIESKGYSFIEGDFTSSATLESASIKSASEIVFATESDFDNMLGIVTARTISKEVKIVSRAKEETARASMHSAGATLCVVPELLAGLEIGEMVATKV
ncbi:MAG: NAD-binding protein [Candidatus Marsarchaeota archaeon]|jgi:voltage-gated potassium channel|nr:NAD-binding protein [Candidatus Marsarchaeota archaeon]MCL5112766.1 NAD-binding protein [Candidatus Marsarchaeota archaeon]